MDGHHLRRLVARASMNPHNLLWNLLGLACTSVCLVPLLAAMFYVTRWHAVSIADDMQSRLQSWAAEQGYRIVGQERPGDVPLWRRIGLTGPFPLPSRCLWEFDTRRRGVWKTVLSVSTCVTVADSGGRVRRGRLEFVRTGQLPGSSFEPRWEEARDIPSPPEQPVPGPQSDPLWDPWIDHPGGNP